MFINTIVDEINLKNMPEVIIEFFRKNGEKKFNNLRNFYDNLLKYVSEDIRDSYLNRILKYLSSSSSILINIIDDFKLDVYDKELQDFSKYLVNEINKYDGYKYLYESLNRKVNYIFYEKEEYLNIKESHNVEDYKTFIFLLLKHTFYTYQINIPGIVSTRLYEEAITMIYDSETRKRMMKASADLGNTDASVLHACHILKNHNLEGIDYLLKAKSKPYALWTIGFLIETNKLNKETISKVEAELSDLFTEDDFINRIRSDKKNIILAIKIYYYIYKKYYFSKSINSIGKLLINQSITYNESINETVLLGKQYLNEAIRLGNVNAITNLSIYYINHPEDSEYDDKLITKLLETSANLGDTLGNYYYGKHLCKKGEKQGIEYLLYSSNLSHAASSFEIAKVYEANNDYQNALEYYKKAIYLGHFDSTINLCKLYILLSTLYDKKSYLIFAKEILDDNYNNVSIDKKEECDILYKDIEERKNS